MGEIIYHNPLTAPTGRVKPPVQDYGGAMRKKSLLLLLITGLTLGLAASGSTQPAVQLSEPGFNFGKTAQHAIITHTFWIKSTGTDTLRITHVEPGCSCTEAPLADSVLAPGDSVALEILFSTRSYRGFVSKRPYIETNASADKLYLRIDCELVAEDTAFYPIQIGPVHVDVSQFNKLPRRKAKFSVTNKSDKVYDIQVIDDKGKDFDIQLPKQIKGGETLEGFVEVHDNALEKGVEQSVTFQINDDTATRFTIPVKRMYRVKPDASE